MSRFYGSFLAVVFSTWHIFCFSSEGNFVVTQESDVFYGVYLPRQVGEFTRDTAIDNEATNPGLGVTVPYSAPGLKATVYVYDLGIPTIPEGPTSDITLRLFSRSVEDVHALATHGVYESVHLQEKYGTGSPARGQEFLCAQFEIKQGGRRLDSYVFLTAHSSKFIKIRITVPPDSENNRRARAFADDIAVSLWPLGRK